MRLARISVKIAQYITKISLTANSWSNYLNALIGKPFLNMRRKPAPKVFIVRYEILRPAGERSINILVVVKIATTHSLMLYSRNIFRPAQSEHQFLDVGIA